MSEHFEVVKVTSKGQMTIPVRARKLMGIKEGDHLAAYITGDEIIMRKFTPFKQASARDAIFKLIGKGKGPVDLAEKHDQYLTEAKERKMKE